jgi:serine/threonine protein phosphatase PrpC
MKCAIKQNNYNNRIGQDFVRIGSNEEFDWIVLADGHGSKNRDLVINIIRYFDWVNQIKCEDFHSLLNAEIESVNTAQVGSTLSVVKIYPDRFETFWIGDSEIKIYSEGESVWKMKAHNQLNFNEMERMRDDKNIKIRENHSLTSEVRCSPYAISATEMTMIPSPYFLFGKVDLINMTHALGHNSLTGNGITKQIIPREQDKKYKVVVASDGLWCVSCTADVKYLSDPKLNCDDHMQMANDRWQQEWKYCGEKTRFPEYNIDDISVATWSN